MSEKLQRNDSLQPLHELASTMVDEMGEQPEQRLEWLMHQTGASFGDTLLRVNATVRGIDPQAHTFDGNGIQAGTIGGSIPPDQEDKIVLLDELIDGAKQHIARQSENGVNGQTILTELSMAIPIVVNKLHLFRDGNGRTTRTLRMVLRDGDQIMPDKVDALVNKKGIERYDTTPAGPVERSVFTYMRKENGTGDVEVLDDVVRKDAMVDDWSQNILEKFPTISPSIIKAHNDTNNFAETVRLIGKSDGDHQVSVKELFGRVTTNPDEMAQFTAIYRNVRRQRVELLIKGLLGEKPIPLSEPDKDDTVAGWFNGQRRRRGLVPVDPDSVRTVQDFQMAYAETFSPQRAPAQYT